MSGERKERKNMDKRILGMIEKSSATKSLLYDLNLLPEQVKTKAKESYMCHVVLAVANYECRIQAVESRLFKVTEERDRAVNLIERLAQWKDAYPKSVFTPVDLDGVAEREGIPIDCISAQVLRVATIGWSDEAERFLSSLTENKS